jgi:hypothetical protein
MQTAIEKLQNAMKLSKMVLDEPMGIEAADSMRLTLALHQIHKAMEDVLKMLSE